MRIAIDVGRSAVKVSTGDKTYLEPMSIIRNPDLQFYSEEHSKNCFQIIKGRGPLKNHKTVYLLGLSGISESQTYVSEGEIYLFEIKMLWELYSVAKNITSDNEKVRLGSTFTFNNLSVTPEYAEILKGAWVVKLGNKTIKFEIEKVVCAPQGYLSFWKEFTDGQNITNNLASLPGAIVDFGEYTTDLAFVNSARLDKSLSQSINYGSRMVWNLVKSEIYKKYKYDASIHELTSHYEIPGIVTKKEMMKLYKVSLNEYVDDNFIHVLEQAFSIKALSWVLVAGGVADKLSKLLASYFPKIKIYEASNPRFSNVEGLEMMLRNLK